MRPLLEVAHSAIERPQYDLIRRPRRFTTPTTTVIIIAPTTLLVVLSLAYDDTFPEVIHRMNKQRLVHMHNPQRRCYRKRTRGDEFSWVYERGPMKIGEVVRDAFELVFGKVF